MLIEYSRSNAEFETCLAAESSLQECLDQLHRTGNFVFRVATDPKLYVESGLVTLIIDKPTKKCALLNDDRMLRQALKCRYGLDSKAYYPVVQSAIANLRKKCKARVKRKGFIDLTNDALDDNAASEIARMRSGIIDSSLSSLAEGENDMFLH